MNTIRLKNQKQLSAIMTVILLTLSIFSTFLASIPMAAATTPSLSLAPASGVAGSPTTVYGTGFTGGTLVNVYWNGAVIATTQALIQTGAFSVCFTVPATASVASYTVSATDGDGNSGSTTFSVTGPAVATPTPTPSPTATPAPSVSPTPTVPEMTPLFAVAALLVATCLIALAIRKKT